jgi:hypothetical protein
VLDEPMIGHYGGDLAGPVFRRVAEASLRYLGVPPSNSAPKMKTVSRAAADTTLTMAELPPAPAGPPPPPAVAPSPSSSVAGPPLPNSAKVPDTAGMGARDAIRAVGAAGLVPVVEGSGKLVRQVPAPGAAVPKGSSVRLVFEPAS